MSQTNDITEQVTLNIDVSLREASDYEKEIGKKFNEMSTDEKADFIIEVLSNRRNELYNDSTVKEPETFDITTSFITTDSEVENARKRHKSIIKNLITFAIMTSSFALAEVIDSESYVISNFIKSMPKSLTIPLYSIALVSGITCLKKMRENYKRYYTDEKVNTSKKQKRIRK